MKTRYRILMIVAIICVFGISLVLKANQTSSRIESSAKKSYVFMTYLKNDDIKIKSTDDGVVSLTGTVSQESHLTLAAETVANLPGVKGVQNMLQVKGEQPVENSDGWISMKVKTSLLFHQNVSGTGTEVDVKEGVVTLRGEAGSEAQKELTAEYAGDIDGVKSVINNIRVKKTAKSTIDKIGDNIDDASITAQVKAALLTHRSTSAVNIKVTTTQGMVTVSGMAKNGAEKDLVTKLVADIHGVKSVRNEITIEPLRTN